MRPGQRQGAQAALMIVKGELPSIWRSFGISNFDSLHLHIEEHKTLY